ncbi:MAG TPA: thiamine pyrophosphate-dependent enzyme [Solirubrobacterales bacterium]|nr:thiamine pyrophosphate-dependent enzyme [Solirubrobacterales bacterium]
MTTTAGTPSQTATTSFREMLLIRRFEERVLQLRAADEVAGSVHPCLGQEAIPVGAMRALRDDDRVVATYRGHGWALAAGLEPEKVMAEICQRATGSNGGRAGSAYLTDPTGRFIGENSIVGAGLPIADGLALAARLQGSERVALVTFGDGATSQGAAHEALVMALARRLPVIFLCENNGWSEMTPITAIIGENLPAGRVEAYGISAATVDGTDPGAVAEAVAAAAERGREGGGPTFVECSTGRLGGHYNADVEQYRPQEDRELAAERDPVALARRRLLAEGVEEGELGEVEAAVERAVEGYVEAALAAPRPDPATAAEHVLGPIAPAPEPESGAGTVRVTYAKAVNEALARELAARPETLVFGEDIAIPGGTFGVTRELRDRFGAERVFDTPIAEAAILGTAIGAAMEGMRPIVEIMWADFLMVAFDQLVNQASNVRYISRGERVAPLTVRCQQGVTPGACAQHAQSLEALLAHVAGLRVGIAATPQDAYSMTRAAIAADDPCVMIEQRLIYGRKGDVDLGRLEPIGGAREHRRGDDVAIFTWGRMLDAALAAGEELAGEGVEATVVDLRWLNPLDEEAIAAAVARCGRAVIAHEANLTGGFGAEVAARIADRNIFDLEAPVRRVGSPDVRYPSAPNLQEALLPDGGKIAAAARDALAA